MLENQPVRIVVCHPGQPPTVETRDPRDPDQIEKIIGGSWEAAYLGKGLSLYVGSDSLTTSPFNRQVGEHMVCGTFVLSRTDIRTDESISITDADLSLGS